MEKSYQITVNEAIKLEINEANAAQLDIIKVADGKFHLLQNNKAYIAEVVSTNFAEKSFTLKINSNTYIVQIADAYDQLVNRLGLSAAASNKVNNVKAPMPGLVLDVAVAVGQKVNKGDGLLILEAMKMENVIKSAGEGTVKSIHVDKGKAVDKGELLIEME